MIDTTKSYYESKLFALLLEARRDGLIIRVETVPCKPLSMGNHYTTFTISDSHSSYRRN